MLKLKMHISHLYSFSEEMMFLETSAMSGLHVEEAFLKCAKTILNKIDAGISHALLLLLWSGV